MYILRLLAGKFGPICTEFPLTTFLAKILTRVPLNFQPKKKLRVNANFSTTQKKSKQSKFVFKSNFDSTMFSLTFFARDDMWKFVTKKHHGKL